MKRVRRVTLASVAVGLMWNSGALFGAMAHLDGSQLAIVREPRVGEQRTVEAKDLASLRGLHNLALSPDGRYAAALLSEPDVAANSYRAAWFIVPVAASSAASNAGDAGEPSFFDTNLRIDYVLQRGFWGGLKWAPDSASIVYLRQWQGAVQVWRSGVHGDAQEQLTHNAADVIDFIWSADGTHILFATAAPRGALSQAIERDGRDGFLVGPETKWSYIENQPFRSRYELTNGQPVIWALDLRTGAERMASAAEQHVYESTTARMSWSLATKATEPRVLRPTRGPYAATVQLADATKTINEPPLTLTVSRSDCAPDSRACRVNKRTGHFAFIDDQEHGQVPAWWREDGKALYFRLSRDHNSPGFTLNEWSPDNDRVRVLLESTDTVTNCTARGSRLVCLRQTPTSPRTIVSIDLRNGAITTLFDPNPQWQAMQLGQTSWLTWSDQEGHPTYAVLVKPVGYVPGRRYPLVVIGYDTSEAVIGDGGQRYPAHLLAARGFVSLIYNHWVAEENWHRPDFVPLGYGAGVPWGRIIFNQLESIIERLSQEGLVDPQHVGVAGFSNGLNSGAYGLINSDRYRAAAFSWIRWNPTNYYTPREWFRKQFEDAGLTHPVERAPSEFMRNLSLSLNAERVRAPILVHASDFEFAYESQMEPLIRFRDAGRALEMHVFPNERHVLFHPAHRYAEYRRNTQWLQFWLQGREADDPVDPGQYVRWHKLREMNDAARARAN